MKPKRFTSFVPTETFKRSSFCLTYFNKIQNQKSYSIYYSSALRLPIISLPIMSLPLLINSPTSWKNE